MSTRANILIVDDRPDKLLVVQAILEDLGQNLYTAASGEEALRHILARDFALILLDVRTLDAFRFWNVGALSGRDAEVAAQVAPFLCAGLLLALLNAPGLNLLSLGLTTGAFLSILVLLALLAVMPLALEAMQLPPVAEATLRIVRWPFMLVLITLALSVLIATISPAGSRPRRGRQLAATPAELPERQADPGYPQAA